MIIVVTLIPINGGGGRGSGTFWSTVMIVVIVIVINGGGGSGHGTSW